MARPGYRAAVEWIALNDDEDLSEDHGWLITVCLVADLFGKTPDDVGAAVKRYRAKEARR